MIKKIIRSPLRNFVADNGMAIRVPHNRFCRDVSSTCDAYTWTPGLCTAKDYTSSDFSPDGYEPTTPISITFSLASDESNCKAQYGFRPISD